MTNSHEKDDAEIKQVSESSVVLDNENEEDGEDDEPSTSDPAKGGLEEPARPRSPGNTDHEPMSRMNVSSGNLLDGGEEESSVTGQDFFEENSGDIMESGNQNSSSSLTHKPNNDTNGPESPKPTGSPLSNLAGSPVASPNSAKSSSQSSEKSSPMKPPSIRDLQSSTNTCTMTKDDSYSSSDSDFSSSSEEEEVDKQVVEAAEEKKATTDKKKKKSKKSKSEKKKKKSKKKSKSKKKKSSKQPNEKTLDTDKSTHETENRPQHSFNADSDPYEQKTEEDAPDWMFRPDPNKKVGALNIRGDLKAEHDKEKMQDLLNQKAAQGRKALQQMRNELAKHAAPAPRKGKKTKGNTGTCYQGKLDEKVVPHAERLFQMLNMDPHDVIAGFKPKAVGVLIDENPEICSVKYSFDFFSKPAYPLSMLGALHAGTKVLEKCIKAYPDALEHCDDWLGTPLHYACAYQAKLDVVKVLETADVAANFMQRTPLHMACMFCASTDVILHLLAAGKQSAQKPDKDGYLPLHLACFVGVDWEVIDKLTSLYPMACLARSNDSGSTPLHLALKQNLSLPIIKTLVKGHQAALEIEDEKGRVPLHVAISFGSDSKIVKHLRKCNPDMVYHENHDGKTPLDLASKRSEIKKILKGK